MKLFTFLTSFSRVFSLVITIFFLTISTTFAQTLTEQMQVIPGELPDPSIIKVDNVYYAAGTSGDWAPHYPIYSSNDLSKWELIGHVFNKTPEWTMGSFWAPELFYKNGIFYCYYTARAKNGISKIGVATTNDITKGFEDKGPLITWGNEAIDAFVYEQDGTLYITWKAYGLTPENPIQILGSKLSEDGLSLVGSEFEILTANDENWEKGGIEGQCIVKQNGYLYMLYSGNNCCGAECDYMVGVARAKKIEGPWKKYESNPLMAGNSTWKCPGHGTAVDTGNGWYYLYHAYNTGGFPILGRAAVLSKMYWNDDNGWPYFRVNEESTNGKRLTENILDDFDGNELQKWWVRNVKANSPDIEVKNGILQLTDIQEKGIGTTGAVLCIVPDSPDFSFSTHVETGNKARKGLVLYTNEDNSLGLGVQGKEVVLWKIFKGTYYELNRVSIKKGKTIGLKAIVKDAKNISFEYAITPNDWKEIQDMELNSNNTSGENLAWWSSGMKAGLQVSKDEASGDNSASFESFQIQYGL